MKRLLLISLAAGMLAAADAQTARLCIDNRSGQTVNVQPEDSLGFITVGSVTCDTLLMTLPIPRYYSVQDASYHSRTVYVAPGTSTTVSITPDEIRVGGDLAAENDFIRRYTYLCRTPQDIALYSAAWADYHQGVLDSLHRALQQAAVSPQFKAVHRLYLDYTFLNQRLSGPKTAQTFGSQRGAQVKLAPDYYDFLDSLEWSDPHVLSVPRWFTVVNTALEEMEREQKMTVSNDHYMAAYARRISHPEVRSEFLRQLISLNMKKGYYEDVAAQIDEVAPYLASTAERDSAVAQVNRLRLQNQDVARGVLLDDFTAQTPEGQAWSLQGLHGKVVLLDFWYTGCIPCKAEMPYVEQLARHFSGQPFAVVSVSLDTGDQLMAAWRRMMAERSADSPVVHVNLPGGFRSPLIRKLGIRSVPRLMLLDAEGRVADAFAKRPSDPRLRQQIEQFLLGADQR
ncbi:MAG: TlpA family protein disulfide reductase [Prevotella sp.]|nr:TlpA family protein disulfide reductase [Prevotella sp.]